jgi:hypothetical protein
MMYALGDHDSGNRLDQLPLPISRCVAPNRGEDLVGIEVVRVGKSYPANINRDLRFGGDVELLAVRASLIPSGKPECGARPGRRLFRLQQFGV